MTDVKEKSKKPLLRVLRKIDGKTTLEKTIVLTGSWDLRSLAAAPGMPGAALSITQ